MARRLLSLGTPESGVEGLRIEDSSNETPIELTLAAGHGLQEGDRIRVSGVVGNTGANGDWTIKDVDETGCTLVGSVGNGTHDGNPSCSVICDTTPFMAGRSAHVLISQGPTDAELLVEGSDDGEDWDTVANVDLSLGRQFQEVVLRRYMRCSLGTTESDGAQIGLVSSP